MPFPLIRVSLCQIGVSYLTKAPKIGQIFGLIGEFEGFIRLFLPDGDHHHSASLPLSSGGLAGANSTTSFKS
jgi:hypothetical protein